MASPYDRIKKEKEEEEKKKQQQQQQQSPYQRIKSQEENTRTANRASYLGREMVGTAGNVIGNALGAVFHGSSQERFDRDYNAYQRMMALYGEMAQSGQRTRDQGLSDYAMGRAYQQTQKLGDSWDRYASENITVPRDYRSGTMSSLEGAVMESGKRREYANAFGDEYQQKAAQRDYDAAYTAYMEAMRKEDANRLSKLYDTDRGAYYGESMSADQLSGAIRDTQKKLATIKDMEENMVWSDVGDTRYHKAENLQKRKEELEALLAQYQSGQSYQGEKARADKMRQIAETTMNSENYEEMVKVGKANIEARNRKALESIDEENYNVDDPDDNNQFRRAEQRRQADLKAAGYISDIDSNYIPEDVKPVYYALFARDPSLAQEFAAYWKEIGESEYWSNIYEQSGKNTGSRARAFIEGTFANTVAGLDPFGEGGQYAAKLGRTMIGGGAAGLSEKGLFNTGALAGEIDMPLLGKKSLGDAYQLGSSMLQSGANAFVAKASGGLAPFVAAAGTILLGSSAAASDYQEKVEQGWDENSAKWHAIAAGTAEAAFEYLSIDKLVNQDITRGFIKNFLVQGGIEASEEACTTIANRISDSLISELSGHDNNIERRQKELMAKGYEYGTAEKMAEQEWLTELLNDAFGGFVSGGIMSSGQYAMYPVYKAMGAVETKRQNERTGANVRLTEQTEALQQYAKDNDLEWTSKEGPAESVKIDESGNQNAENNIAGSTLEQQLSDAAKQTPTRGEIRKQSRQDRTLGADARRVQEHIAQQMTGKTVEEKQALRDELVTKYGESIAPTVYEAITSETARQAAKLADVDAIRAARNEAMKGIKDAEMKRAVVEGYDSAAYTKALRANDEAQVGRYYQQLRNSGAGEMSMEAIVKGEDGTEQKVGITGMTEDGKRVKLADGSTVAVRDLQADADTADAVQRIARMDLGANADAVLKAYRESGVNGADGYRWLMDYTTAFEQGRTNRVSLEQAVKQSSLDAKTVMQAYELGQKESHGETQRRMERVKNAPKKQGVTGRTANIDTSEVEGKTMNASELEQFDFANKVFSLIGVNLKWFSSEEDNGKYKGKNGAYENGTVYMDIHAGRNFVTDINSGILATTGHELTHFLQQYAPQEYQTLKGFLFRQIAEKRGEQALERLVWEKQRRSGYTISKRVAEDEVVADACQTMLRDSKALREFARENESAAKRLIRWLDEWFTKLKDIFSRSASFSEEARFVNSLEADIRKAFGDLWDTALREAVRTHDEVGAMESKSKGQNSDRDAEYLDLAKDPEKNAARLQEMVDEAAEQAMPNSKVRDSNGKLIRVYHGTPHGRFTRFDYDYAGKEGGSELGYGHYFTPSKKEAGFYTQGKSDNIYSCYINIENPIIAAEKTTEAFIDELFSRLPMYAKTALEEKYGDIENAKRRQIGKRNDLFLATFADRAGMHPGVFNNLLGNMGYDGVILEDEGYGAEYVVFESAQAKLADPVTRDNTGKIIPLSERFDTFNPDIRYQDRDTEYLDAVNSGDMETAQRMVDEAAREAGAMTLPGGKRKPYYHGTTAKFTSFDINKSDDGTYGYGFYFSPMRSKAEGYGEVRSYYIMTERIATRESHNITPEQVLKIRREYGLATRENDAEWLTGWLAKTDDMHVMLSLESAITRNTDVQPAEFLQKFREVFGYDGLRQTNETVLFDNRLIKSADPVTYDDSGNVIPLSERFNTENQDTRYSQREQYEEAVEASDVLTRYSLREEPAPQKTIKAYKAFYVKDGKLYPPMVSNNTNEEDKQTVKKASSGTMKGLETPVGVWLDADVGGIAVDENGVPLRTKTTGRLQVQNDKGGGTLAFRPGWHLGEWPDASQFNVKDPVTGALKSVMPDNLVFAECEIAADVDYQLEAYEYGISDKGGFSRTQAGLPRVPTNGYYKYRTNVDPTTAPWYITGAMKVTRILSDEERRQICNQFGVTPQERASHKDIDLEAYGLKAGPVKQTGNLERFRKNKASYDNDALLKAALEDENYSNAYVRRTLDFDNETLAKEFELDRISPDQVKKYRESYQSPEVMRSERESAANANVSLDFQSESAAPSDGTLFSERTWTASRFVQDKANAANALAKALGVSERTAKKYINNINSVAKLIADDRVRLDYESAPGLSSFKSNAEYGGSIDFSTLCKKRRLMTGTFSAIQNALPNTVLTEDDVLLIRKMMKDAGLEVSCGLCYVEGSRTKMGEHNAVFLERYKQYYPKSWQPTMADVTTPDGIEKMRINHPEAYEKFEYFYNHYGKLKASDKAIFASQQKPKMYQLRTEYNGEILQEFKTDQGVETKNRNGGLRLQSFSDFEIVHLIDCMQVIADMSEVGLAGQAYTKVPEFAEALGKTGLKINLSLITKSLDADGKLVFDDVEGMPHERAFDIRKKYSKNVGTILVVYDDAQLLAAMADPRIDFIIPFHISQWKKSQFEAMGLPPTAADYNYQLQQNEKWLDPEAHAKKATNYMPNEYWDFSLSGKQNAEKYLEMCAKDGKRPKFYKLLQNNGDGSFSLKDDGSTDGYWKLLIDFKMYDNKGRGAPQQAVKPLFDMKNVNRMLEEYQGGHAKFPVAQGIVDEFVNQYKADHPGRQYSERDYANVEQLSPSEIVARNAVEKDRVQEVRDRAANSTEWQGRPILAYEGAGGIHALTGSHRLAVARLAGYDVNAVVLREKELADLERYLQDETYWDLDDFLEKMDEADQAEILHDAVANGYKSLEEASLLMEEEIESNNARYSMRDYDNTLSDYDLIMGIDEADVEGADPKAQLRETKQRITRVQSLRNKLADTRAELKAAEKKIAELTKPGSGINAQKMRAARAEARLGIERAQAKDRQAAAVKREHDQLIETRKALRVTENKLAKQLQREEDILAGKLTPPAMQRMLKDAREAAQKQVEERKDKVFQNYKDRRRQSDLRNRIKNLSDEMKRRMTNPSERAYVPASLYESMTRLTDVLGDLLSPQAGTKAAEKYRATLEAIRRLSQEYKAVENLDDTVISSEYDKEIQDAIDAIERTLTRDSASWIAELTGDTQKGLRELTTGELQHIYELMRSINYNMVNATTMLGWTKYGSVYDTMRAVADQQQKMTPMNEADRRDAAKRGRLLHKLSTMRAVEMMSDYDREAALYQMMHAVEQGVVDADAWVMRYDKAMHKLKTGKNELEYRRAISKKLDNYNVKDARGNEVLMTKMQAIQILMTAEREAHNDNLVHLQKGGAVIRDKQSGKSYTIQVTPELLQKIRDSLTEWDKAYMQAIRDYFRQEGKATNQVLYKLKHRVLQTEEYYVPYMVDKNYLETKLDSPEAAMNMWVKTPGATNTLKQNASQPVYIDGMDAVMGRHVRDIANYIGMAIPIRDFSKVYNGMLKRTDADTPLPVKETIHNNFGDEGQKLLTQAIIDVQGGRKQNEHRTQLGKLLDKMQSAFYKKSLLINAGVTIKQAASYVAAASIIDYDLLDRANHPVSVSKDVEQSNALGPVTGLIGHLFVAPNGKTAQRIFNEIDEHTSIHYIRRQGMSMQELAQQANKTGRLATWKGLIGAGMEQNAAGHIARQVVESISPLNWIQRMDVATTATIWVACKLQARRDGFTVGSQEYWQHTTELYERCLRETQPMYDALHRSEDQKDRSSLMQYLFPFRTVPIQNHGQLVNSYENLLAAQRSGDKDRIEKAGRFFRKTVVAQVMSAAVFSVFTAIAAGLKRKTKKYRDDDDEITLGTIGLGLGRDVVGTLFSVFFPMFGSAIWDTANTGIDYLRTGKNAFSYDAFSVGVADMLNNLWQTGGDLGKDVLDTFAGRDVENDKFMKHLGKFVISGLEGAGVPATTAKSYWNGASGNIKDILEGRFPAFNNDAVERSSATNASRYFKAIQNGDMKKAEDVLAEMREDIKDEKPNLSEKAVTRKLHSALTSRIKELYMGGDIDEGTAIQYMVDYAGKKEDDAFWKLREWEAKEAHKGEDEYSFSPYEHLRELIDDGKDLSAEIDFLQEHGKSYSAINSDVKGYIKDCFKENLISEDEAMDLLQKYHKVKDDRTGQYMADTADEAWFTLDEWKENLANEDDDEFSYAKYRKIYEAMDSDGDASAAWAEMNEHGVSDDTLKKAVSTYLQKQLRAGEIDEETAMDRLQTYRGMDENEAYWQVDKWTSSDAAYAAGEEFNDSDYRDLYDAIDKQDDATAAVKELVSHGYKESDVNEAAKKYLKKRFEEDKITEKAFRNLLSKYAKIYKTSDADALVNDAKFYKETGHRYGNLGTEYKEGTVSAQQAKSWMVKYDKKSKEEADKTVRYWDYQKRYPAAEFTDGKVNNFEDGTTKTKENNRQTAKQAGMTFEQYLKARAVLDEIKDSNGNGTGEDEYIAALGKMTGLTSRQKDALYYERYKGTTKYSRKTW